MKEATSRQSRGTASVRTVILLAFTLPPALVSVAARSSRRSRSSSRQVRAASRQRYAPRVRRPSVSPR